MAAQRDSSVFLGRFVKPFGIKGELKFVGSDDFWPDVLKSSRIELRREVDGKIVDGSVKLKTVRPHGNHFVVTLDGVNDRNAAELQVGGELFVDIENLDVDLPDWELPFQVIGTNVKTEDGKLVGSVKSVLYSSAHPVYVVEGENGEVMVPAVPEFVIRRDDQAGEIIIRPIEGLLDG